MPATPVTPKIPSPSTTTSFDWFYMEYLAQTQYIIAEMKKMSQNGFREVQFTSGHSLSDDTGLTAGIVYNFRVDVGDSHGGSAGWTSVSVTLSTGQTSFLFLIDAISKALKSLSITTIVCSLFPIPGNLRFINTLKGSNSYCDIANGTTNDLFAPLIGYSKLNDVPPTNSETINSRVGVDDITEKYLEESSLRITSAMHYYLLNEIRVLLSDLTYNLSGVITGSHDAFSGTVTGSTCNIPLGNGIHVDLSGGTVTLKANDFIPKERR